MIPDPQRTYVLEFLNALGPAAEEFVVAGAQAMKFMLAGAHATKDVDFVLDVEKLRGEAIALAERLEKLGYAAVEGARNFQFEKPIPNSPEAMRIEFMAPEEFRRGERDFRVDVQRGVHARACTGGTIALAESEVHQLAGRLPNGTEFTTPVRVIKPHALVMLKLLALDDRYRNIRGPAEAKHDREEARCAKPPRPTAAANQPFPERPLAPPCHHAPRRSTSAAPPPSPPSSPAPDSARRTVTPPTSALETSRRSRSAPAMRARSNRASRSNTTRSVAAPASSPGPARRYGAAR